MDWLDYREKLGIAFNDEEKYNLFLTKLFNILNTIAESNNACFQITGDDYFSFCNMTGTRLISALYDDERIKNIIEVLDRHTVKIEDFLSYYMAFVNCQTDNDRKPWKRAELVNLLSNMLSEAHILFEVFEDSDGYFVFPKGVEEMDNALVSQPLTWLGKYPKAQQAWIKALKHYADSTATDASDVADLFRKALETFFQEFFNNGKTLENNKKEYGDYLKMKGIPKEISGNFETILQSYTNYMNHYAKHHDATSEKALEYIMYQTGNIIRLLITL